MAECFEAAARNGSTDLASIAIAEVLRAPKVEHKDPARLAVMLAEESVIQAALRIRAGQLVANSTERETAIRQLLAAINYYQKARARYFHLHGGNK